MREFNLKLKQPKTLTLPIPGWPLGLNTLVNAQSINDQELAEAVNVAYTQYGVLSKRAGTQLLVTLPKSPIQGLGTFYVVNSDGSITRTFLAVAGGTLYKIDPINFSYSAVTGFTFHPSNPVSIKQWKNFIYFADGYNTLVKWDGTTFTQQTALLDPGSTLSLTKTGTGTGQTNWYYVITAYNAAGETNISNEVSSTSAPSAWNSTTYATLNWTAVSGATGYNIYRTNPTIGGFPGDEFLLASVTTNSFTDQGQYDSGQSAFKAPPTQNTTAGIVFDFIEIYKDTIFGVDKNTPFRLWYSGGLIYIDNFAPEHGGGYIDYHAEEGSPITGLKAFAGLGKDYLYVFKDRKIGQASFGSQLGELLVSDVNLSIGASSNLSITPFDNDLAFWSRYGMYTLRMEQAYLNVLRVAELSAKVHNNYVEPIQSSAVGNVCGIFDKTNHVIVQSIPLGTAANSTSLAFDTIYQSFAEYRGVIATAFTRFIDVNMNEFSYGGNASGQIFKLFSGTSDLGNSIYFRAATKIFDMKQPWMYKFLQRIFFLFGNVNAQSFTCTLIQDGTIGLAEFPIGSGQGTAGWGTDFWDNFMWGTSNQNPLGVNARNLLRYFDANKNVLSMQAVFEDLSSTDTFEILSLGFMYQQSTLPLPSSYKVQTG